jgi:DNA-binding MarR family transcriptional regulator
VTPWIDDDQLASAWHDLMRRYHRVACALDRSLTAKHGLTSSDFEVLEQLCAAGPERPQVRMSELGERVHLTQSAFSRLIGRLESAGLLARTVCDDDRRSAWIRITDAGVRRYLEARPTQRAILRELGGPVGAADEADDRGADGEAAHDTDDAVAKRRGAREVSGAAAF